MRGVELHAAAGRVPAEIYDRHMVPAIFVLWVSGLLDVAALQPGERLLDVARGLAQQIGLERRSCMLCFAWERPRSSVRY